MCVDGRNVDYMEKMYRWLWRGMPWWKRMWKRYFPGLRPMFVCVDNAMKRTQGTDIPVVFDNYCLMGFEPERNFERQVNINDEEVRKGRCRNNRF